ncbi:MAG: hypothetical protein LC747_08540, partial [Acidobacteria bacterium]|nr:hypothetical protein [Acidobacteriota bacterium]
MKLKTGLVAALIITLIFQAVSGQQKMREQLSSASSSAQTREGRIARAADALRPQLIAQRRDFHMHPELSNREERTARVVAERLKSLGFDEVRTGV